MVKYVTVRGDALMLACPAHAAADLHAFSTGKLLALSLNIGLLRASKCTRTLWDICHLMLTLKTTIHVRNTVPLASQDPLSYVEFGKSAEVLLLALPGGERCVGVDQEGELALAVLRALGLPNVVGVVQGAGGGSMKERYAGLEFGGVLGLLVVLAMCMFGGWSCMIWGAVQGARGGASLKEWCLGFVLEWLKCGYVCSTELQ